MSVLSLGTNTGGLRVQASLSKSTATLEKSFARLSTGLRINSASDDAAGLSIADSLRADTRIYTQGIRNLNDGLSALSIAQGALESLSTITIRLQELSEQAANGVYNNSQRVVMQSESDKLVDEYNRVLATTKFNGQGLFNVSGGQVSMQLQGGIGSEAIYSVNLGEQLSRGTGTGTFANGTTIAASGSPSWDAKLADINGDSKLDLITAAGATLTTALGNGDGTFQSTATIAGMSGQYFAVADFNNDGKVDIAQTNGGTGLYVTLGNGNGTFAPLNNYIVGTNTVGATAADINGDGIIDLAIGEYNNSQPAQILLGNGNGTFRSTDSVAMGVSPGALTFGDFNGDGKVDIAGADGIGGGVYASFGSGNGIFGDAIALSTGSGTGVMTGGDFNRDGFDDFAVNTVAGIKIFSGSASGSLTMTSVSGSSGTGFLASADLNGDGYLDFVAAHSGTTMRSYLSNGDGTYAAGVSFSNGLSAIQASFGALGDINNDGGLDLVLQGYTDNATAVVLQGAQQVAYAGKLTLTSQSQARSALETLKNQLARINSELGSIGSFESRLSVGASTLLSASLNYTASESRIRDVDVAEETSSIVRAQILQQVGASVLQQSIQNQSLVLKLLS
jgi:flagellin-like hook-associated protein FlgL